VTRRVQLPNRLRGGNRDSRGQLSTSSTDELLYPAFYAAMLDRRWPEHAGRQFSGFIAHHRWPRAHLSARIRAGRTACTAIYCMLFWLYFRAHGCRLLMTENLGLLLGVIGLASSCFPLIKSRFGRCSLRSPSSGWVRRRGRGHCLSLPALALYAGIRVLDVMDRSGSGLPLCGRSGVPRPCHHRRLLRGEPPVMKSLSRRRNENLRKFCIHSPWLAQ